ncbi:MAG: hypothetical protein AB7E47_15470 [Desulfovibrionaceae bacterium]
MSDDKHPMHTDTVVEIDPDMVEIVEIAPDMIEILDEPPAGAAPAPAIVDDAPPPPASEAEPETAPQPMGQGKEDRPDPAQFKELPADIEWPGLPSSFELPQKDDAPPAPEAMPQDLSFAVEAPMTPEPSLTAAVPLIEDDVPPLDEVDTTAVLDTPPPIIEDDVLPPLSPDAMAELELSEYGMGIVDNGPPPEEVGVEPLDAVEPVPSLDGETTPMPAFAPAAPEPLGVMPMDADQAAMLLIEDDYMPEEPAPSYEDLPPREVLPQEALPLEPLSSDQAALLFMDDEPPPCPAGEDLGVPGAADEDALPAAMPLEVEAPADAAGGALDSMDAAMATGADAPSEAPSLTEPKEGETRMDTFEADTDQEYPSTPGYADDDDDVEETRSDLPGAPPPLELSEADDAGEEPFVDESASMVATIGAPFETEEELSDAFPEDEDGLADLTGQEEEEEEAEPEEEEPEEPQVDTQWSITDPGKYQPFLMSLVEDQMLLFSGPTVKQLQNIGECTSYFNYLIDFESSNSMGVIDIQGEFKFAEVMLRKSLEEQGELGRDDAIHIYYKRRKTKSLTSVLYQVYPKRRLEMVQRAYEFYQDGFIIFDTLGMLYGYMRTLDPKVTHALALRTSEAILFLVGQGSEVFSARRIVMLGDDEGSLTEGIFALQREADAINASIPGELEHIEWILPYSEQLIWKPHPAWKIPIKLRPVTRMKHGDKTMYTALPSIIDKLKPEASLGPKEEKLLRPMEKAERWLWAALFLLSIGFAASYYYVAGMSDAATDENNRISMQIKAVERRMPQLPHYMAKDIKPVLTMAGTINTAAFASPLAEVWNKLALTKPKACRLDSVTFAYRDDGITLGLSGEVELGLAHAQRVFAEFIESLGKGGFQVKNQSISLDIQGNHFQLDLLMPEENR